MRVDRAGGEEWDGHSWFILSKVGKPRDYLEEWTTWNRIGFGGGKEVTVVEG